MAKENVKKFFEAVSKNEDLQKQLKEATQKKEAEIAKAVKAQAETIVEVAKKAGFDFTVDELIMHSEGDKKLDQDELDAVAGGTFCTAIGIKNGCAIVGGGDCCVTIGFEPAN